MAKQNATSPDRKVARSTLAKLWEAALSEEKIEPTETSRRLINSGQVAIRFCLPTQLLGKLVDNRLDALCLQRGKAGSDVDRWDPRGFAARVVVPWNRENQNVLGASGDPYVSNPLRRARVDHGLEQMGDREEWETLCSLLVDVQNVGDPEYTRKILYDVLIAVRDRLRDLTFSYIVPERVSLKQALDLIETFLSERSGGDRGLSVTAALFETLAERLHLFSKIRRGVINASDASTKAAGDIECLASDGSLVLAVEVKERTIGNDDVQIAIAKAREFSVKELILCCDGIKPTEAKAVESTFATAWASGTNLYQVSIQSLMIGMLPLLGEHAIRLFISNIGKQLDEFGTQPKHRKTWKSLLDTL